MAANVFPEIGIIERRMDGRCEELMIGVDGDNPSRPRPFYPSASRTLAELFPLGPHSKENLFRSVPQSFLGSGTLVAPPHMSPLFKPCFHQRNLLRFLLQSPFSHDHSSPSNAHSNNPHAPFDDFQCIS